MMKRDVSQIRRSVAKRKAEKLRSIQNRSVSRPLQHLLILLLILLLRQSNLLLPEYLDFAFRYNLLIVAFNLLPVWPLDGGNF